MSPTHRTPRRRPTLGGAAPRPAMLCFMAAASLATTALASCAITGGGAPDRGGGGPSPFAAWIPDCPSGPVEPLTFVERPGGVYGDERVISLTSRACFSTDHTERTDFTVYEFVDETAASAHIAGRAAIGQDGHRPNWRPQQPYDEVVRRAFASTLSECASVGRQNPEAECYVSDLIEVRVGRVVVAVETDAQGHIYAPPSTDCGSRPPNPRDEARWEECLTLASVGPSVAGDARWSRNEATILDILTRSAMH